MSEATAVPEGSTPPQSLLAQMERLLAALDADLGRLDADLQADPGTEPDGPPIRTGAGAPGDWEQPPQEP